MSEDVLLVTMSTSVVKLKERGALNLNIWVARVKVGNLVLGEAFGFLDDEDDEKGCPCSDTSACYEEPSTSNVLVSSAESVNQAIGKQSNQDCGNLVDYNSETESLLCHDLGHVHPEERPE